MLIPKHRSTAFDRFGQDCMLKLTCRVYTQLQAVLCALHFIAESQFNRSRRWFVVLLCLSNGNLLVPPCHYCLLPIMAQDIHTLRVDVPVLSAHRGLCTQYLTPSTSVPFVRSLGFYSQFRHRNFSFCVSVRTTLGIVVSKSKILCHYFSFQEKMKVLREMISCESNALP
jgi:hypothetical protein